MVHLLKLHGHERVLEIGTGSGYQLAILAQLALEVYSVERLPELGATALRRLEQLGFLNVHMSSGNGTLGWSEHAPYDAIVVAAGAPQIPQPLVDQLGPGGKLVIPVGSKEQQTLLLAEKRPDRLQVTEITQCVFVPLVGEYGWTGLF
jgi:protein-L-isoaspartate(D-aspartate) O-methyltransferase